MSVKKTRRENRQRAARYRVKRKDKGNTPVMAWIPDGEVAKLQRLAERDGLIAETGAKAGKPSRLLALRRALEAGLAALGIK